MDVNTKHIAELLERNEELKMKIIAADACDTVSQCLGTDLTSVLYN